MILQKQKYLGELGTEYQILISDRVKQQITERIDQPAKKVSVQNTGVTVRCVFMVFNLRQVTRISTKNGSAQSDVAKNVLRCEQYVWSVEYG